MTVKRYRIGCEYAGEEGVITDDDGDYVSYEDYAALKAERDELNKQVVNLAVENAVLSNLQPSQEMINAAHKETEEYDNINLDDDLIVFVWQAMHSKINKSATDVAIANIQAQGVEMFVEHMDYPHSPCEFTHGYMDKHALEFSAGLRKGATDEQ